MTETTTVRTLTSEQAALEKSVFGDLALQFLADVPVRRGEILRVRPSLRRHRAGTGAVYVIRVRHRPDQPRDAAEDYRTAKDALVRRGLLPANYDVTERTWKTLQNPGVLTREVSVEIIGRETADGQPVDGQHDW